MRVVFLGEYEARFSSMLVSDICPPALSLATNSIYCRLWFCIAFSDHPVNLAYEAATADIGDFNVVDKFHQEAYGVEAVNYNRDIEAFPLLQRLISGKSTLMYPLFIFLDLCFSLALLFLSIFILLIIHLYLS